MERDLHGDQQKVLFDREATVVLYHDTIAAPRRGLVQLRFVQEPCVPARQGWIPHKALNLLLQNYYIDGFLRVGTGLEARTTTWANALILNNLAERGGFEPPLGCLFPKTV